MAEEFERPCFAYYGGAAERHDERRRTSWFQYGPWADRRFKDPLQIFFVCLCFLTPLNSSQINHSKLTAETQPSRRSERIIALENPSTNISHEPDEV